MLEWAYSGVNASIPRNRGPECSEYLSPRRRILETMFETVFILSLAVWSLRRIVWPSRMKYVNQDRRGRKYLLLLMTLVFGIEIGFKLSSQTFIYILNPCHIITALQIYLLVAEPSPLVTVLFRLHLNFLNGPVLAYMFPETECRVLYADKAIYYIQHGLMVVIPYYLLRIGGVFNMEPLTDLSWPMLAYSINLGYHFWVLQFAGMLVEVNLSHMVCPAILDPFEGQNYRLYTTVHQLILCPALCRIMHFMSNYFLTQCPLTRIKPTLDYALAKKCENDERLDASKQSAAGYSDRYKEQKHHD